MYHALNLKVKKKRGGAIVKKQGVGRQDPPIVRALSSLPNNWFKLSKTEDAKINKANMAAEDSKRTSKYKFGKPIINAI